MMNDEWLTRGTTPEAPGDAPRSPLGARQPLALEMATQRMCPFGARAIRESIGLPRSARFRTGRASRHGCGPLPASPIGVDGARIARSGASR